MFVEGCEILHLLARSVEPDYKIVAFRAGGWAVQPFSLLKKAFLSADIRIDSSVSYGIKNTNKDSYYDFTNIPRKSFYKFTDSIEEEETEGLFTEVPITLSFINLLTEYSGDFHLKWLCWPMERISEKPTRSNPDGIFLIRPCLTPLVCPL